MVLERHRLHLAIPDRRTPNLATLANEQVPCFSSLVDNSCSGIDISSTDDRSISSQSTLDVRRNGVLLAPMRAAADIVLPAPNLEQFSKGTPRPLFVHRRGARISASEVSISRASSSRRCMSAKISEIGRWFSVSTCPTHRLGLRL